MRKNKPSIRRPTKKPKKSRARMPHDNSYKLLFSHSEMVRDLLIGFVKESWVAEIDFSTLEKMSGNYITDDLRDREDDIIWRVRFRDRWLYLYLLIEFQSTVDTYMAVRVMTYLGLLYQDIIKQKWLTEENKLPPVLPIVLYNGKEHWGAKTNIADLIDSPPGRLIDYQPHLKYLLLDEVTLDESAPLALKNLVAALFRLEKSVTAPAMAELITALMDWLNDPAQDSLRRAFTVWLKRVLIPNRFPDLPLSEMNDLLEIKAMLSETVVEWTKQWKQEGLNEGMMKGLNEGMMKGLNEGMMRGKMEGKIEGKMEGMIKAKLENLERLLIKRFGVLSEKTRQQLNCATLEQLDIWFDRAIESTDLDSIFKTH